MLIIFIVIGIESSRLRPVLDDDGKVVLEKDADGNLVMIDDEITGVKVPKPV